MDEGIQNSDGIAKNELANLPAVPPLLRLIARRGFFRALK